MQQTAPSQTTQAPRGPVPLSSQDLAKVSGAGPNGGWCGPNGGWM